MPSVEIAASPLAPRNDILLTPISSSKY